MGTRVRHAKYGNGTILRTEGDGDEMKLTISFMSHGLKKMIAKYAELEVDIGWISVTLTEFPEHANSVNVTKTSVCSRILVLRWIPRER